MLNRVKKTLIKIIVELKNEYPKLRISKLCKLLKIARSTFYYCNKTSNSKEQKDKVVLDLLYKLPANILRQRGSKTKTMELRKQREFTKEYFESQFY